MNLLQMSFTGAVMILAVIKVPMFITLNLDKIVSIIIGFLSSPQIHKFLLESLL